MTKKCKCGCGKEVKRKFALGHNSRVPGYTSGQYKKDHSVSKETREKMRDAKIGTKLEPEHIEKIRQKMIGRILTEEHKKKISKARRFPLEEINHMDTLHQRVWEIFGKDNCERCNKLNSDHIKDFGARLDMHCKTKNYHLITEDNWSTLCRRCHTILEAEING